MTKCFYFIPAVRAKIGSRRAITTHCCCNRKNCASCGIDPLACPSIQIRRVFHKSGDASVKLAGFRIWCFVWRISIGDPSVWNETSSRVSILMDILSPLGKRCSASSNAYLHWKKYPSDDDSAENWPRSPEHTIIPLHTSTSNLRM